MVFPQWIWATRWCNCFLLSPAGLCATDLAGLTAMLAHLRWLYDVEREGPRAEARRELRHKKSQPIPAIQNPGSFEAWLRYCPGLIVALAFRPASADPSLLSGQALKVGATPKLGPHPLPVTRRLMTALSRATDCSKRARPSIFRVGSHPCRSKVKRQCHEAYYFRLSTFDSQLLFRNETSSSQINACTIGSSAESSLSAGPKNPTRPSTRNTTRSASLRASFMS